MTKIESPIPSSTEASGNTANSELDFGKLFASLWRGRWVIVIFLLVFTAGGVGYALNKPNIYQAVAVLAPTQSDTSSVVGGQLGGLASLAGVRLGGGAANRTTIAKEVLRSRAFLRDFIHRHDLVAPIMAGVGWDVESEKWLYKENVYDPDNDSWLVDDGRANWKPSDWDLIKRFRANVSISDSRDSGLITLSVRSLSPQAAKAWVEWLIQDINEYMREQDISEAEASISYLQRKLNETNIAGMKQVFYQLIENETRTVMLANAQREYVFKTVDPAIVPEERVAPRRDLIAVGAAILGVVLAVFIVLAAALIRSGLSVWMK